MSSSAVIVQTLFHRSKTFELMRFITKWGEKGIISLLEFLLNGKIIRMIHPGINELCDKLILFIIHLCDMIDLQVVNGNVMQIFDW